MFLLKAFLKITTWHVKLSLRISLSLTCHSCGLGKTNFTELINRTSTGVWSTLTIFTVKKNCFIQSWTTFRVRELLLVKLYSLQLMLFWWWYSCVYSKLLATESHYFYSVYCNFTTAYCYITVIWWVFSCKITVPYNYSTATYCQCMTVAMLCYAK